MLYMHFSSRAVYLTLLTEVYRLVYLFGDHVFTERNHNFANYRILPFYQKCLYIISLFRLHLTTLAPCLAETLYFFTYQYQNTVVLSTHLKKF